MLILYLDQEDIKETFVLPMKFAVIIVALILFYSSVFAQSDILKSLSLAENDTQRMAAYHNLFDYYHYSEPDSAVYYTGKGLQFFNSRKFMPGIAVMTTLLASFDEEAGRLDMARDRHSEAMQIFLELHDKNGIAYAHLGLGQLEGKTGNYAAATKHFIQALKGFETVADNHGIVLTYLKLGVVNELSGNLDKALNYYGKALTVSLNEPVSVNTLYLYNNIGIIYFKKGDTSMSMSYFQKALEMANGPEMAGVRSSSYMNMGNVYKELGNDPEALKYYKQALSSVSPEKSPEEYTRIIVNIANILTRRDPAQALASLQPVLEMTRKFGQKELEADIMAEMFDIYKAQGNYKMAMDILERQTDLRDSLLSIEKAKEIASLQAVYELDKSNERITELELANQRNARKKNIIVLIASGLALTLIALSFSYRKTRILNRKLYRRETELQKANTVKDRLFSIIGHDLRGPVGNIPMVIDMYRDEMIPASEKEYLLDSIRESSVITLETLDKLLHWGESQIKGIELNQIAFNTEEQLQHMLKLMKAAADSKQITVSSNVPANTIIFADPDHFNFIIRNLLSNAIKFTNRNGSIEINADKTIRPHYTVFSIKDNGLGMSEEQQSRIFEPHNRSTPGTNMEKGNSLGLMLCRLFVTQNEGEIWIISSEGLGTTVYFSMKTASA